MTMHLVAFSTSADQATIGQINPINDQVGLFQNNNLVVPQDLTNLIWAYPFGPNITRAQVTSPSLRALLNPEIAPVDRSATPSSPLPILDLTGNPWPVVQSEQVTVNAAEDGAGATRMNLLLALADQAPTPMDGEIVSVRVTSATTLVGSSWTNGTLTFDQALPAGRWAIVGARFQGTSLIAFRFVLLGETYRPGGMAVTAINNLSPDMFRMGRLGNWGEFEHNLPPTVDFLANAADTAQAGVLDLIQVRAGAA